MHYSNNQTLSANMSLGCLNKKLEKLLNGKKFQNRILNAQRVRLQKFKK